MHSYYSKNADHNRVKEMTAEEFVNTLLSNKIDIFSITDHDCFSSKYYKDIFEYIKDKKIKCIPGVELNIYVEDNYKFQANFYFSLDVDFVKLENAIKKLYGGNNKPKFSDIIDQFYKEKFNFIIFPEANKSGGIQKIIGNLKIEDIYNFKKNGMQRVYKAYDSTLNFNKTSANMWAFSYYKVSTKFDEIFNKMDEEKILKITDAIVSKLKGINPNIDDNDYEIVDSISKEISNYANDFTYFHFSDWHNNEKYVRKSHNYIFGNIDLPFESLELAVLDPVSRVNIIPLNEEIKILPNNIKKVSFVIDGSKETIDFSVGLNAIVGKRASGKSLLMAILLKLFNRDDIKIKNYVKSHKIDIDSIECVTFGDETLKPGQLGSVEYIEQDTISKIFNDPTYSTNGLNKYFGNLEDLDLIMFNKLIEELKKLKPYDLNFKSVTSYINNSFQFKSYALTETNLIQKTELDSCFSTIIHDFDTLENAIKKVGFSSTSIEKIKNEILNEQQVIDEKINLYNLIFEKINDNITIINENNTIQYEQNNLARLDCQKTKKIIFNDFDMLLCFKKIEYLVNNFKMKMPKPVITKKGSYIFISSCNISTSITDLLNEYFDNCLLKNKNQERGIDLLKKYLYSETSLKTNITSLYSNLEKKFISDNLHYSKNMYELKSDCDIDKLKNPEILKEKIDNGVVEDISNSSLGRKSIAYLELMLDSDASILLFDQPEDNVDNNYISNYFVPLIKRKKKTKQLIFITHNPSVAVYADAFNYIYASNDGKITYSNHYIESISDKQKVLDILDGGSSSFSNRNLKYGNIIGEYNCAVKNE